MKITLPDRTELDQLRATHAERGKQILELSKRYERGVDAALAGVTSNDIQTLDDVMTLLGLPGRRAYDLVGVWLKSLGSRDVQLDGLLISEDGEQAVGPAVLITVPHPSTDDYAERFDALVLMLSRYQAFMEPAVERLGAGGIVVKIMDNDLSTSGIPSLWIARDGTCEFHMTRYGRETTEKTFPTPADALEWLSKNRWYGEPYPEREEYPW